MNDDMDDDDAIIRDADIPVDVAAMLGLTKECDEDKASTPANRWRPWVPVKGVIPRMTVPRSLPRRRSPKVSVVLCLRRHALILSND